MQSESHLFFFWPKGYCDPPGIAGTKKEKLGIPLTGLTPPHFSALSKQEPGFLTSYVVFFFYIQ